MYFQPNAFVLILREQKIPLPAPTFPSKKQRKLKQPVVPQVVAEPVKRKDTYDLWEADFVPKVDLEFKEAGEHMLRYTKKKLPKMPKTCRFKPSLLDAVSLPAAGASYNPTSEDYQEYVTKIAQDEVELMKEEERIQNAGKPKTESIVTHAERQLEVTEGLTIDPRYNADTEDVKEDEAEHTAMDVGSPSGEGGRKLSIFYFSCSINCTMDRII
ncbi:unnamed protein product [Nippostrongylus brasiliensis]|uniref:Ribosome biogenesis protein NOP53 n=1 Tax=Nippostrongylus brasiliensis TaxID=27835 RepID=A0A0N4XRX0_NIPBR|nr:unnamed protein product [Nippostrongylus brasiliensis]